MAELADLARGFREGDVSIWSNDYDELAILSAQQAAGAVAASTAVTAASS